MRNIGPMVARFPYFDDHMKSVTAKSVAVGVSGGPDSMALCRLLSLWSKGTIIHAITVDHGLRAEAADEAQRVGNIVGAWPNVRPVTLRWEGDKPDSRILEEARAARYALMSEYMKQHGIRDLFIAHHQDDQAETFLIRLAKGSGLDGLAAMKDRQERDGIILHRPLLNISKNDLIAFCGTEHIDFMRDPTNENEQYLRPRLRAAKEILEEEGLSAKRLSVTAARLNRARTALEVGASDLFDRAIKAQKNGCTLDWNILRAAPEELILRVLLRCVDTLYPEEDYAPRMEKMESLLHRLLNEEGFKSATLGGCLFAISRKNGTLSIEKESP